MTAKTRVPLDMYNCFRECDVGTEHLARNANAVVDNTIRDLIGQLSHKHPRWQFVDASYSGVMVSNLYTYRDFTIEDSGNVLGTIRTERHWRTGDVWYELTNPRLAVKRERRGPTRTKLLKKAIKLIDQHYYGPTLPELMGSARREATSVVGEINSTTRWEASKVLDPMKFELLEFLEANHDIRTQLANAIPSKRESIKSIPEVTANRRAATGFNDALGSGSNIVLLSDDKIYLLDSADPEEPRTFDTVPKHIAMAVGMLKLVDIKGYIPNIGVRATHNVFYVMPPQENTQ